MKCRPYILLFTVTLPILFLAACEEKVDYAHIIFKNYLTYEINRAISFLDQSEEGTKEGQYHAGSKQQYQQVVDNARLVDQDLSSTQEEIDEVYAELLQADEEFSDEMVPFRSRFQVIIDYANVLYNNTEEGEEEGNARPGSKAILQAAIDDAESLIARDDLTQRMLDQGTTDLNGAIYAFNDQIIGQARTAVINDGFEEPGYETTNFGEVEGWSLFGKVEDWAPRASVAMREDAPEGTFVARIGSYTQGIYQTVFELLQPNATYTLEFDVSLTDNGTDWQGKRYPAILRTRIFVFDDKEGFYDLITTLTDSYDTLGIAPGGFVHLGHSVTVDATSVSLGKKVSIDFSQRHTWDAENPIWAESFVAIDNVKLYRKQ